VVGDIDVCIYIHIRICLNIKVMTMIILLYTQYYILYYYYLLMFIIVIHWLKWRIRTVIVTGDNTSPSIYVHTSLMLCRWTIALCSFSVWSYWFESILEPGGPSSRTIGISLSPGRCSRRMGGWASFETGETGWKGDESGDSGWIWWISRWQPREHIHYFIYYWMVYESQCLIYDLTVTGIHKY